MQTDISVIIPFYNTEKYILQCINGVMSQKYDKNRYEIIMIDNNSTDAAAEIARRNPSITLLSESKQGAYAARNRGIAEAKGKIIVFTDSDCSPATNWLEAISEELQDPYAGIILGSSQFASDSLGLSMLSAYEAEKATYVFSNHTKDIYYGYTNNMAVRKELFDRLGGFMEIKRGADVIFVQRAINEYSCNIVRYAPNASIRHLEITSIWKWYRKMFIYGKSYRNYSRIVTSRPLNNRERGHIFKQALQRQDYCQAESVLFFVLLMFGAVYYQLGQLISEPLGSSKI